MGPRFSFRTFFVAAPIAGVAVAVAITACGQSTSADSFPSVDPGSGAGTDASPTNGAFAPNDAAPEKSDVFRGNPLCRVPTMGGCMPDDAYSCSPSAPDGGGDASADPPTSACRVSKSDASAPVPACGQAIGQGTDGATCMTGADCAAGFDCVESSDNKGSVCRQYCCLGTCGDPAASSSATFCDVQKLVDAMTVAPVCMPLKPCQLLSADECGVNETCAVVNENGDTGCVLVGDAQVGKPCDEKHCAAGLTCLGQPGNRKCQRLCKIGGDPICAPQSCVATSAFKDSSFGICQ